MKHKPIVTATVIICAALLLGAAGCGKVWMSADYRQQVEMSNVVIQSLNSDCRAGDDDACRRGLAESAAIVQLIIDAVHGVESQAGEGGGGSE